VGGNAPSTTLKDAMRYAHDSGVVICCAASNSGASDVSYPAAYSEYCLAVAATDADDQRASFSSYGPAIDAAAPGVDIHSTYKDGTYITASGTSASTAFASGLAALLLSREPLLTPDEIEKQIQLTCDDVNAAEHPGYDEYLGAGRINAAKALAALPAVPQTIHAAIKYDYDQNGNLISRVVSKGKAKAKGNAFTTGYSYDYENRLTGIVHPDGTTSAYRYDGGGRRIQTVEDGVATNFLYDGLNGIIERDNSGTTRAFYHRGLSYGGGIGGIISAHRNREPTYYHNDGIGAVTGLTDANGALLQSYAYDAFGNALSLPGNIHGKRGGIDNPYGFSTKEYNHKSGLIYFGARYYDPVTGRFITKDLWPGTVYDPGTLNKYAYCVNNPVNLIDPLGLCPSTGEMLYDFMIGDDINTLRDPNAGAGYKLMAAASIASNFTPGGGVVKGVKLVRLTSKGMKFTVKGAGKNVFKSQELLDSHYTKHASEFGNITKDQYLKGAQNLTNSNPGGNILTKARPNGDALFYNKATNEFAVKASDGTIRTYFKPTDGINYFNRQ